MPADQIIVIRHAQKPTHKPKRIGIREDGTADPESLTVRGWQHAGALAAVFAGPWVGCRRCARGAARRDFRGRRGKEDRTDR